MLDEGAEEFVVERLVPGLSREHLAEVGASLTHNRLEVDHGRALGGHRHVLGRGGKPDDVRPVVGKHWLVPRDAWHQLPLVPSSPIRAVTIRTSLLRAKIVEHFTKMRRRWAIWKTFLTECHKCSELVKSFRFTSSC